MKYLLSLIVFGSLFAATEQAVTYGPFSLELTGATKSVNDRRALLDDPINYAIASKQRLGLTVELDEKWAKGDAAVKRIIVEPYVFGLDRKGQPVLRGNIVGEEMVTETTNPNGSTLKGMIVYLKKPGVNSINLKSIKKVEVIRGDFFNPPATIDASYQNDLDSISQKL